MELAKINHKYIASIGSKTWEEIIHIYIYIIHIYIVILIMNSFKNGNCNQIEYQLSAYS